MRILHGLSAHTCCDVYLTGLINEGNDCWHILHKHFKQFLLATKVGLKLLTGSARRQMWEYGITCYIMCQWF